MKRIATLFLAAGLLLGASSAAQAADVKLSGTWDFQFVHADKSFSRTNTADRFGAMQRLRTKIDIIASENLKGVVGLEIGTSNWGKQEDGMGYGDRPNNAIKLRWSYVDWVVPTTDLKVRMGKQPFATPAFTFGSTIMDRNGTGIVASYDFNENVGLTVSWLRAENDNSINSQHDAFDLFGVTVPMNFDGFKATPYAYVGSAGANSLRGISNDDGRFGKIVNNMLGHQAGNGLAGSKRAVPWWAGIATELSMFDPFSFALDGAYGSIDMGRNGNQDIKRSGWYVAALAQYKLDMMTLGFGGWYGSGDDGNDRNGSERMPSLQSCFTPTDFGFDGYWYETGDAVSQRASGTWGVLGQVKDLSFVDDLTHKFIVAYYRGTNSKNAVVKNSEFGNVAGADSEAYLTRGDSAFEVDFQTKYDIYKDLALVVDLAYIRMSVDEDVWSKDDVRKNAYKAAVNMRYSF